MLFVPLGASASRQAPAGGSDVVDVRSRIVVTADQSGTLTLGAVRRSRGSPPGRRSKHGSYADMMKAGVTWLRFVAPGPGRWYLVLPQSVRRGSAFAVQPDGTVAVVRLGTTIPIRSRPFESDENVVQLPSAVEGTVYYVRAQPALAALGPLNVFSARAFQANERRRFELVLLPTTFLVGALLALALLGIMLGIVLRQRSYVYYACTLAAFAASDFIDVGAAARWLWPHTAVPPDALSFVARAVYGALLLAFCLTLQGSTRSFGFTQRFAILAYCAVFLTADLYQLVPSVVAATGLWTVLDPLLNGVFLIAVYAAAVPHRMKMSPRRIAMLAALGVTLLGISLGRAAACGLIPWSPLTADLPAVVLVLQAMVLAAAFARRVERVETAEAVLNSERSQLEDAAMRDVLTAIPNRRAFEQRLAEEWRRAAKNDTEIGVVLIDVDHFKLYNDTFGHTYGDEVLHEVARAIAVGLRGKEDFVARYGGEEFIIILPSCGPDDPGRIAERLRAEIEALAIPHPSSPAGVLTISAGAANSSPKRCRRANTLIEKADAALYAAKRNGRNRVSTSDTPFTTTAAEEALRL